MDESSKTLITFKPRPSLPNWLGIPVRILAMTFIGSLLSFSVTLLFAIVGTVVLASLHGVHPDMRIAYLYIALPVAIVVAVVIVVFASVSEIRRYRQGKTLRAIERMS